jgi:phage N-6-adenine-methyltransferase
MSSRSDQQLPQGGSELASASVTPKMAVMFSRASDEWSTPDETYEPLRAEFDLLIDVAATRANTKSLDYFGPGSRLGHDALTANWSMFGSMSRCWMNPPYSRCREFIGKAAAEARKGCTVVALVPSRTDTRWWHDHVWDACANTTRPGVEIRFIKGRLKFGNSQNSAPFPSVVIVFRPPTGAA